MSCEIVMVKFVVMNNHPMGVKPQRNWNENNKRHMYAERCP